MDTLALYNLWLQKATADPDLIAELSALAPEKDGDAIFDRFYRDLEFGTGGLRGVIGAGTNRLNIYNVRRVTRALAKYILTTENGKDQGVAIAYDSRNMSDVFAKQAALVLCAAGVKVFLYESLRPVPVLSFTIRHLKCIAGIVITASHNPKQYNGYKAYCTDGGQMPPESVKGITDRLPETTYAESLPMDEQEAIEKGLLTYIGKDVDDAYIAAVKKLSVNPELAKEMGETLMIYCYRHWDLPKGHIDPGEEPDTTAVREVAEETGVKGVKIVRFLCNTLHAYGVYGVWELKQTSWYLCTAESCPTKPQKEEDIPVAKCCSQEEVEENLRHSYPTIRNVFAAKNGGCQ